MRADAQENHDRLLEAAARAFARDGADASLKAVAQDAGVGIGTLYRRFPTRERLIEATYRNETARLCAAAPELLRDEDPLTALRAWMDRFVDYMTTKHGMGEALHAILVTDGEQRMRTRDLLVEAIATLITAGVGQGVVRPGVDPEDVMMALGGITMIADQEQRRDLASRLLDLLLAGVSSAPRSP